MKKKNNKQVNLQNDLYLKMASNGCYSNIIPFYATIYKSFDYYIQVPKVVPQRRNFH